MKIHFLGATRTTTGSMYLLEVNGRRLLLECGLFQGHRDESIQRNCCFPFDPRQIDAVVLSHAHIDHAGNLPNLVKQGYAGPIHCTPATRDLCGIMLVDSAHIQTDDATFVSKKRARHKMPPVEPLYAIADAEKAVRQFVAADYDRPFEPVDGVTVTFRDAGHILGAAQVVLDVREGERKFRWLFSGDIGRGDDEILRDPEPVENVDYLQIESTYGGREHAVRQDADAERLPAGVGEPCKKKARSSSPRFPSGAPSKSSTCCTNSRLSGCLPRVPIFVDSPLSVNATEIYRKHTECFNDRIAQFLHENANPFGMENLTYIREAEASKKLNDLKEPVIIISASGMCEAGRIRHHLKNNLGDAKNLVLFIGYCAEHTLGAQIGPAKAPSTFSANPTRSAPKSRHSTPTPATPTGMN